MPPPEVSTLCVLLSPLTSVEEEEVREEEE